MFLKQVTHWLQNKWLKLEAGGGNPKLGKLVLQVHWGAKLNCCWSCISRAQQHHGAVTARILLATTESTFQEVWGQKLIAVLAGSQNFQPKNQVWISVKERVAGKHTQLHPERLALAEIWLPAVMLVSRQNLQTGGPSSLKMSSH